MTKHISLVLASLRFAGCGMSEYHFTDLTPLDGVFAGSESFQMDIAGEPDNPSFGRCIGDIVIDVDSQATPQVLGQGSCTVDPRGVWTYTVHAEVASANVQGEITLTDGQIAYALPIDGQIYGANFSASFGDRTMVLVDGSIVSLEGGFVATRD